MKASLRKIGSSMAVIAALSGLAACGGTSTPATPATSALLSDAATTSAGSSAASGSVSATTTTVAGSDSGPGPRPAGSPAASVPASAAPPTVSSSAGREISPAGDIPDNQAFVKYTPTKGGFSVSVPEGWARTDTTSGVLFTDKYNSIRVESRPASTAPTVGTARSGELPAISASARGFAPGAITMVNRKAGPAVLITYKADTPPNAVTGKVTAAAVERYEFFKAGREVIITVAAPVGGDNVDPWRKVTDSFSWSA